MAKTPTTITDKDGSKKSGYIDNGKTYYSNGSRINEGSSVVANNGKEYVMKGGQGVETGNNYSVGGNQGGGYKKSSSSSSGNGNYLANDYYTDMKSELERQRQEQEDAIRRRTEQTVNQIYSYKPKIKNDYEKQQEQAYVRNQKAMSSLPDLLSNMGYTGGMAESTALGVNTDYENIRRDNQSSRDSAIEKINQMAVDARISGDTELANAANSYYTNYQNIMQNQQQYDLQLKQFDMQRQEQDRQNYLSTLGAFSNDYQARIDELIAEGYSPNSFEVLAARSNRNDKKANQAAAQEAAAQQEFENWYKQQQLGLKERQVNYQTSKPYFKPAAPKTPKTLSFSQQMNNLNNLYDNEYYTDEQYNAAVNSLAQKYGY